MTVSAQARMNRGWCVGEKIYVVFGKSTQRTQNHEEENPKGARDAEIISLIESTLERSARCYIKTRNGALMPSSVPYKQMKKTPT
jgi:hypothetical protein